MTEKSRLVLATWLSLFNTGRVEGDLCCNTGVIPPAPTQIPILFLAKRIYKKRNRNIFLVVFYGSSTLSIWAETLLKFSF
jgi:hypothetical protein